MVKRIRDTIHGYIHLTRLEEVITQHPLVLRLHYVHQTSFTYLTYPNAQSTRYPHTLGVMHVAGEIFKSALDNTPSVRKSLAKMVKDAIDALPDMKYKYKDVLSEVLSTKLVESESQYGHLVDGLSFVPQASGADAAKEDPDIIVPLVVLYQALRLVAIFHDVGHPPFSHIVEYALREAEPVKYKGGHEGASKKLARAVLGDTPRLKEREAFKKNEKFSYACLKLACDLMESDPDKGVFAPLKASLLDGDVDADRLDYVRRDAYTAGLVSTYDTRRLVESAFIREYDAGRFEIAYTPSCLSSIENFFTARYDLYRWMIYHHDVARRNLAIQRAVTTLLTSKQIAPELETMVAEFKDLGVGNNPFTYQRFVDSYFLDFLWRAREVLSEVKNNAYSDHSLLLFYLEIVLDRRNDKLKSVLKGQDDYARLARWAMTGTEPSIINVVDIRNADVDAKNKIVGDQQQAIAAFNAALRKKFDELKEELKQQGTANENVAKFVFGNKIEAAIQGQLEAHGRKNIVISPYYLGTFKAGIRRDFCFSTVEKPKEGVLAHVVSPTLNMLEQAWSFSPQILFYFRAKDPSAIVDQDEDRARLMSITMTAIRSYLGLT